MSESRQVPVPPIRVALYGALCASGLGALIMVGNLLVRGDAGLEPDMYLGMAVSWITSLLVDAWVSFVMLSQIQRHARRGMLNRPWLAIVGFGLLAVGVRYLWFMLHHFLIANFLQNAMEYLDSTLFNFLNVLVWEGFELVSTFLCALLALKMGGRREAEGATPASGSLATWVVQALTLSCGLYFIVSLLAGQSAMQIARYGMDSMLVMQLMTNVVPLCVALVLGCCIYACWPRRLQQASGWGLYLWGALLGCLGSLPAVAIAAAGILFFGIYTEWLGYAVWPVYAVGVAMLAVIIGWCWRDRTATLTD